MQVHGKLQSIDSEAKNGFVNSFCIASVFAFVSVFAQLIF